MAAGARLPHTQEVEISEQRGLAPICNAALWGRFCCFLCVCCSHLQASSDRLRFKFYGIIVDGELMKRTKVFFVVKLRKYAAVAVLKQHGLCHCSFFSAISSQRFFFFFGFIAPEIRGEVSRQRELWKQHCIHP